MRNQYKVLAEKYKLIEEGYSHDYPRMEYLFDTIMKKPGANFFVSWLANSYYNTSMTPIPDSYKQEEIDSYLSDWLNDTFDNFLDRVEDELQDDEQPGAGDYTDIDDEAEDRTLNRILMAYSEFLKDKESEDYKAWKSYEAAQKDLKKGSDEAGVNLDV